jgi:uncharacterized protein (TIGR02996 family)
MSPEADMLAALRANPRDDAARLVYADWLIERGDERGELLMLDHADRTSTLELASQRKLLGLASIHGFAWFEPEPPALEWDGGGSYPVHYWCVYAGQGYDILYRHGELIVRINGDLEERIYDHRLADENEWTDGETYTLLRLFGEAIQRDALDRLRIPSARGIAGHAAHLVRRDHAEWCERWERYLERTGVVLDRPVRSTSDR